jgi:hypothetical protein
MLRELSIDGVLVSPLLPYCVATIQSFGSWTSCYSASVVTAAFGTRHWFAWRYL